MEKSDRIYLLLLSVSIVVGIAFRLTSIFYYVGPKHDDAISLLAATGHQGEQALIRSQKIRPYGEWVEAAEWKRLLRIEQPFCFATIHRDLANHDIHPPLYFWGLHVFLLTSDSHFKPAMVGNVAIDMLTVVLLVLLGQQVFGSRWICLLPAAFWFVSPAVFWQCSQLRAYSLLTLLAVSLAYVVLRSVERPKSSFTELVCLFFLALGGLLTHYHFVLLIAACFIMAAVKLFPRRPRRLTMIAASLAGAVALFIVMHLQGLSADYSRSVGWLGGITPSSLDFRIRKVAQSAAQGVSMNRSFPDPYLLVGLMVLCIAAAAYHGRRFLQWSSIERHFPVVFVLCVSAILFAGSSLLYLFHLSPPHAVGGKYLGLCWPFAAFLPVLVTATPKYSRWLRTLFLLLLLWFSMDTLRQSTTPDLRPEIEAGSRVVLAEAARGYFPSQLQTIPDSCLVFLADAEVCIARQDEWYPELRSGDYICLPELYRRKKNPAHEIQALITDRFELVAVSDHRRNPWFRLELLAVDEQGADEQMH